MKIGFLTLLTVFAFAGFLRAGDNWLQNGDFYDGINHWRGNGRAPADFAPDNPLDKPDPLTSKGLIVVLHSESWIKVEQDFKGKSSDGILTIHYLVTPDFAFSSKIEDYTNMPGHIGFNAWKPFDTKPGTWVLFLADFGTVHGTYYEIEPKLGSTDPQVYQAQIEGLTPLSDKTVTLAFPPGTGKIVILSISMTDASDNGGSN
jgi:hypothetical protein